MNLIIKMEMQKIFRLINYDYPFFLEINIIIMTIGYKKNYYLMIIEFNYNFHTNNFFSEFSRNKRFVFELSIFIIDETI